MSIVFSDTTTYKGLVQMYEKEIGANRADVSGNANRLLEFTADANMALDDFIYLAITSSGTWQFDDSNHTDYPIVYTNLVDGQRDYSFTTDENSNLILDIYKVLILNSATAATYQEIKPIDQQTKFSGIDEESATEGVPFQYDKTANGIFLNPTPSYDATKGLKLIINREGHIFVAADTTAKAGVPGLFHSYFYLKPAMHYARRKNLSNYKLIQEQVLTLERDIKDYYSQRERDVRHIMTPKRINYI